jgi:hypothetical protein
MADYDTSVFVNVPFDRKYRPLFRAMIFTIFDCGYVPRCALEEDDGGRIRIEKLYDFVSACGLGIHDISRTEVSGKHRLPRFNMPLELGVFLGAKRFGATIQRKKSCLILDRERYRYQEYCSDIAGQDIRSHEGDARVLIARIRDWLNGHGHAGRVPGGTEIAKRYARFADALPRLCRKNKLRMTEINYKDHSTLVSGWLKENPWKIA